MISLGIKFKREGNQCERCKKDVSEVGKLTFYTEYDFLCCDKCIKEITKEKNLQCSKCKKVVGLKGLTEHHGKQLCYNCMENVKNKEVQTEKRKSFLKKNWFKWIMIGFATIALLVAVYWNK